MVYSDIQLDQLDFYTEIALQKIWEEQVSEAKENDKKQKFEDFLKDAITLLKVWGKLSM